MKTTTKLRKDDLVEEIGICDLNVKIGRSVFIDITHKLRIKEVQYSLYEKIMKIPNQPEMSPDRKSQNVIQFRFNKCKCVCHPKNSL